ncbi:MAG TPA: glycosyltransferase [Gemmatimonadaceae bacterium]|nr:glycosyltransferase [Gemmatimonadaceae bacterium]
MLNHSMNENPLLADVGIVGVVPEEWGGPWMSRHQVMSRLARYFHVAWMNPARGWRDQFRLHQAPPAPGHPFPAIAGFHRYRPPRVLPLLYRPAALAEATSRARFRQVAEMLRSRGCKRLVLYLWRPENVDALDRMPHDISLYHIVDEYSFSDFELAIDPVEDQLLRRVDQVIIGSPALMEKKGSHNPNTIFVPNGVDYAAFAAPQREPDELRAIPHPRIGYVGKIKRQLDFALLHAIAERRPDWNFVFIGPKGFLGEQSESQIALRMRPNVTFLGGKSPADLPGFTQHLDVCLLSYLVNDYTKFIYPLKLHEYLASGRPIVGSPIRTLREFAHLIDIADTPSDWVAAISRNLRPEALKPDRIAARRAAARPHDWSLLVDTIASAIAARLGEDYSWRLADAAFGLRASTNGRRKETARQPPGIAAKTGAALAHERAG